MWPSGVRRNTRMTSGTDGSGCAWVRCDGDGRRRDNFEFHLSVVSAKMPILRVPNSINKIKILSLTPMTRNHILNLIAEIRECFDLIILMRGD